MIRRFALLLAGAFALASCSADPDTNEGTTGSPSPLLYEIADSEGQIQGWLFGTIHTLPDGVEWRTPKIDAVIDQAQVLVVEVGDLADTRAISATFTQLATTPGQADIRDRVAPEDRPELNELLEKGHYTVRDFASVETWAAALMLAQVTSTGSTRNGVDSALLNEFPSRRVRELEGTLAQLGIFDRLSSEDQSDLLAGIIDEYRELDRDPDKLRRAWLAGDEAVLEQATRSGIMADPELYEALLSGRNRDWMDNIELLLEGNDRPLIAVGAAHLVGPDGLAALLTERGYMLSRLQ